jgi:parallel beta-helix repeat protein
MRIRSEPLRKPKVPPPLRLAAKLAIGLCALAGLGWPGLADAISCGDTLGPGGSEALDGDLACDVSPALTIVGPMTFDLNGFAIFCVGGSGGLSGTGIGVTGVRAKVRNGTIADCDRGVAVEGDGRHNMKRLRVISPGATGDQGIAFQVKSDRNRFIRNVVEAYAGEGFRLGDEGIPANRNFLKGNEAVNNRNHGFRVRLGERNLLLLNRAEDNVAEGFRSQDGRNRFVANTAIGNGDEGFRLRDPAAQRNQLTRNTVEDNGLVPCSLLPPNPDVNPGIAITNEASNNRVISNRAHGNCVGIAIVSGSLGNKVINNTALDSRLVDLADGNVDCDDNQWRRNEFDTSAAGPTFTDLFPECIR